MPATVTACLLAVTAIVAFIFYQQAQSSARAQRKADTSLIKTAIADTMQTAIGRVSDLAATTKERWPRSRPEFAAIASGLLQVRGIDKVSLVRYLTAAQRPAFERLHGAIEAIGPADDRATAPPRQPPARTASPAAQRPASPSPPALPAGAPPALPPPSGPPQPSPTPTKSLAALRPSDDAVRLAPHASRYFVVTQVVAAAQPRVKNLDLGGEDLRRIALLAAATSGQPTATAPVSPLAPGGGTKAISTILYAPVYARKSQSGASERRLAGLQGFVAVVYRDNRLLSTLEGRLPPGVSYKLRDGGTALVRKGMPLHPQRAIVPVAGREWLLSVGLPSPDLSRALDTLLVGGVLSLLLGLLSVQASHRERHALALVERRIVEQRLAESARETAERRFRTAFSEAPIGMALIAPDNALIQVNRALTQITGYSEDELLSLTAAELTHPEERDREAVALRSMQAGATRVHDVEKRLLHASGTVVWVAVHTTLIRDENDQPAYYLSQFEDITARRRYESRLQHLADHDSLTGLLNRRAFERALKQHLDTAMEESSGAVIVIDLDDFKQVNDTLGHRAGDELIARVAAAIRRRLRTADVVARLGGDEFAVLLRSGGKREAEGVARSLLQTIQGERAARGPGGRERPITASVGVAPIDPSRKLKAEEALAAADLAMYDAKEAGRDRVEVYGNARVHGSGSRKALIETRLEWVERIRAALDEDKFVLHAQPVVETSSGRITQYELLVRMLDADESLIAPGSFLPVAERYGLVKELDRWVVSRAILMLSEEVDAGRTPTVEINLSGQSLSDPDLPEHVGRELAAAGVSAKQLIFEVTETAAIGNIEAARNCAERLGALGCRFALDDFGAGFGSFYYVKHLPFDFIKIDGEFVRECVSNDTDRLVIAAVVELARGLSKKTVAEFVGDDQTFEMLKDLGVDYAQGFHLGRPDLLARWLSYASGESEQPDRVQV